MAHNTQGSQSHLGFFVAMLVVAVLGYGAWRAVDKYYFPTQQQQATAAANPGLPHPPKDKKQSAGPEAPVSADGSTGVEGEGPR